LVASYPYSWIPTRSISIAPVNSIIGTFTIKYHGGKDYVNWDIIDTQRFNFFILKRDITTEGITGEKLVIDISENYSLEYYVELPINIMSELFQ
jgi:hypothetical protein